MNKPFDRKQPPSIATGYRFKTMAGRGNSKKRRMSSPTSSTTNAPARSKQRSKKNRTHDVIDLAKSDEGTSPSTSDRDDGSPESTQASNTKELTDEQELRKALRIHKNQLSPSYASFHPPELSDQKDKKKNLGENEGLIITIYNHLGHLV
ncbi:uncharacterized protein PGTG_14208 [Puccinia graminis f. sp. tritici CRL 75-36-700-3]|uniref:Uncharacterized protein n=1 Tax=Puccinia graminis f. sp. tritici (strain CRL 75-36-700-3 / race SCCL) TaxID=418459 RepID=E3KWX6_PUCGT|nr:uncharacterized protein PGTG_14208 [Puccinia graminis f. sp. tritici CRL 75-36-700-3]EFP88869.1 hypothetical protein PGTG_14208 [Puccinia graminis f. sp. tritici CRL 75-36-700-3]